MHALYLRPAVPLRCSLRNGHLVPNGGSIIRARERRGVRLSGVRTVHTGPLAKSPIIQRTLTLFPLALGTFRRIFFNLNVQRHGDVLRNEFRRIAADVFAAR